ncbi:hypothetical protein C8R45DRAFT_1114701 [Mycena sanguinolenta]|nr:hypothetical protein C8R45DRAFT_1114701 [Mycena sanguinolenta]
MTNPCVECLHDESNYGVQEWDVEDAAVLGALLGHLSHPAQLLLLLGPYQDIRYERTRETQLAGYANHLIFHLVDGLAQQARDESMRMAMEAALARGSGAFVDDAEGNANVWANRKKSQRQFSYDAEAEAKK